MDLKIDHVAIAVNDIEEAARIYKDALGADTVEYETVESEGVRVAIIRVQNGRIELMQPIGDKSPIKKFLDARGPGLHHIALQTPDINSEVARMKDDAGVRFLGDVRPGSEGTQVTFIHPKSLCGVLAELCSPPKK